MKKVIVLSLLAVALLTGCGNHNVFDTKWTFKYADIEGVGTVEIQSWNDFTESDMIQITDKNGVTYLTHSVNVVMRTK